MIFLTLNGRRRTISDWAKITGISAQTIRERIYRGWTQEEALTTSAERAKPMRAEAKASVEFGRRLRGTREMLLAGGRPGHPRYINDPKGARR